MVTVKTWDGSDLSGLWQFTYKLDGVRCFVKGGVATAKSGKPLYNISPDTPDGDYEVYLGTWEETISAVRTIYTDKIVAAKHLYSLAPLDARLKYTSLNNPTAADINHCLTAVVFRGYEGLILRQGNTWLRVKPIETYDVPVLGCIDGKGKHEGRLGALVTTKGNVGTGFSDSQREEYRFLKPGTVVEVECTELTKVGNFRHPRFKRLREDK